MFIKEIKLTGVLSFMGANIDVTEGMNVIVGPNGSGKSNLLTAIQLLLCNESSVPSWKTRASLLHKGTEGADIVSAAITVLFDNTAGRMELAAGERPLVVEVSRSFGLKKDDFKINKSFYHISDVRRIFAQAGCDPERPYHIIAQGEVSKVATMTPEDRLNLVEEVAGVRLHDSLYESDRKSLNTAEADLNNVLRQLKTYESQLETLKAQTADMHKFTELDLTRRAIESVLNESLIKESEDEVGRLKKKLQDLDQHEKDSVELEKVRADLAEAEEKTEKLNRQAMEDTGARDRQTAEQILAECVQRVKDLEEATRESKKIVEESKKLKEKLKQDMKSEEEYSGQSRKKKAELNKKRNELTSMNAKLASFREEGGQKFRDRRERDGWYNARIAEQQGHAEKFNQNLKTAEAKLNAARTEWESKSGDKERLEQEVRELKEKVKQLQLEEGGMHDQLSASTDQQRASMAELHERKKELEFRTEDAQQANREYNSHFGWEVVQGAESVTKALKYDESLKGVVYGTVMQCMKATPGYEAALKRVAGANFGDVIVKDAKTAEKLIGIVNKLNLQGRVSTLVLDKLRKTPKLNPSTLPPDVQPLASGVKMQSQFDVDLSPVSHQLFSFHLVAENIDHAIALSEKYACDSVTLAGETSERKGALFGGGQKVNTRVFDAMKRVEATIAERRHLAARVSELDKALKEEQEAYKALREERSKKSKEVSEQDELCSAKVRELNHAQKAIEGSISQCMNFEKEVGILQAGRKEIEDLIAHFKKVISSDFSKDAAEAQRKELERLTKSKAELEQKEKSLDAECKKIDAALQEAQKHRAELQAEIEVADSKGNAMDIDIAHLENAKAERDRVKSQVDGMEKTLDYAQEAKISSARVDKLRAKETKLSASLGKNEGRYQALKIQMEAASSELSERQAVMTASVGGVSEDIRSKYDKKSVKELRRTFEDVEAKIGQLNCTDPQVVERYHRDSAKAAQLRKLAEDLQQGNDGHKEALRTIRATKKTVVSNMFIQLSEAFTDVFSRLVPTGRCRMVLKPWQEEEVDEIEVEGDEEEGSASPPRGRGSQRRGKKRGRAAVEAEEDEDPGANLFAGVEILANFSARSEDEESDESDSEEDTQQNPDWLKEAMTIEQLSGGQKTLLALCLLLAIQRVSPHPICILDEIDAALDDRARERVVDVLKEISSTAQCFITTFKKELLGHAQSLYGVSTAGSASSIAKITHDEAMRILESDSRGD